LTTTISTRIVTNPASSPLATTHRFAISVLDYEDAEQAREELHAALAILSGDDAVSFNAFLLHQGILVIVSILQFYLGQC
jgi:hypothetical protein